MHRKMKDSGVEWIGQIPERWGVNKVKYASAFNPNTTVEFDASQPVGYVPMDSVKNGYMKPLQATYDNLSTGLVKFQEGDIVMAKVTPCFENGNIAIAHSLEQKVAFGSSELFIFRNQNINRFYLFYFLQMTGFKNMCVSTMTGTGGLKRVSAYYIKNAIIPYPPQEEQNFIAAYLDEKVAHIDNIIDKTKKTIEEYKKYKQALITEAVTKGLNPDVKMKDSGVEWIGQVPEHWGITKVKYASAFNPNTTKEFDASQPVGYVPMDSVKNGYMKPLQATYENLSTGLVKFQEGDIVMAKVTPCFENGNIAIADSLEQKVAFGSSELFIFRNQNINRCYLFYFLQMTGFKNMCVSTMTGTGGLKRVSAYFIKNAIIPFPPQEEQSFIVKHLKDMCNSVDVLISQKQDIISNLESYKKSLIYEVVTGKYEVGK